MRNGYLKLGAFMAGTLVTAVPAMAQGAGLSDTYLQGTWKEDRTCRGPDAMVFDFLALRMPGRPAVGYQVTGPNEITLSGSSGSLKLTSQHVDADTMLVTFGGRSAPVYRCNASAGPGPVAPPPVPAPPVIGRISAHYLEGRWKDNGLCIGKTLMTFNPGSTVIFKGAPVTAYAITGPNSIAITTPSGPLTLIVRYIDANKIQVDDLKGNVGEAWRCTPTPPGFAPPPPPAAPYAPAPSVLDRAFLFGRWTLNNCAMAATFRPDGVVVDSGGGTVRWALGGNFLTFTVPGGNSDTVTLRASDATTLEKRESTGAINIMRRCP